MNLIVLLAFPWAIASATNAKSSTEDDACKIMSCTDEEFGLHCFESSKGNVEVVVALGSCAKSQFACLNRSHKQIERNSRECEMAIREWHREHLPMITD
ncbi:hypothetical protein Trydic_g14306 [Trypoxylus dichotomus]